MKTPVLVLALAATLAIAPVPAQSQDARQHCSIRPPKGADAAALQALAKVSKADALQTAIDSLKTSSPVTAESSELEVEHDCLVWSFDLKVTGAKGIEEVQVDAGSGRVVAHEHEGARHEKKDKAEEAR